MDVLVDHGKNNYAVLIKEYFFENSGYTYFLFLGFPLGKSTGYVRLVLTLCPDLWGICSNDIFDDFS